MNNETEHNWRIVEGYQILTRRFDNQYAVFHCGSGDTHLLNHAGFCILNELNGQNCSFQHLLKTLEQEINFESVKQCEQYLNDLLSEFQKLTIIEQINT